MTEMEYHYIRHKYAFVFVVNEFVVVVHNPLLSIQHTQTCTSIQHILCDIRHISLSFQDSICPNLQQHASHQRYVLCLF